MSSLETHRRKADEFRDGASRVKEPGLLVEAWFLSAYHLIEACAAKKRVPGVRSAVLFGSAARGSATEESDIDIFIECNPDAEDPAWKVLLALDRRFDVEFSVIYYRPEERDAFDKQFLESIVRQGRVLFGGLPRVTPVELDLQPLRLVSYQTSRLSPRKRAQFLREIDGYRTQKRVGKKTYVVRKPGFL